MEAVRFSFAQVEFEGYGEQHDQDLILDHVTCNAALNLLEALPKEKKPMKAVDEVHFLYCAFLYLWQEDTIRVRDDAFTRLQVRCSFF